jgi:hypothetical protein
MLLCAFPCNFPKLDRVRKYSAQTSRVISEVMLWTAATANKIGQIILMQRYNLHVHNHHDFARSEQIVHTLFHLTSCDLTQSERIQCRQQCIKVILLLGNVNIEVYFV